MKVCLLIGFSYPNINNVIQDQNLSNEYKIRQSLPGIIIELYNAHNFCFNMNPTKMIIITDIITDGKLYELRDQIFQSYVKADSLDFITRMNEIGIIKNYSNKLDMMMEIKDLLKDATKIFIYYTGHVFKGDILLPLNNTEVSFRYTHKDELRLSLDMFRNFISKCVNEKSQIFYMFDCCGSTGLKLPYQLKNGIYRLRPLDKVYMMNKIICCSSTTHNQTSPASKNGSDFSHSFFKHINKTRSLQELLTKLIDDTKNEVEQTPNIFASYPNLKIIWRWLLYPDTLEVTINLKNNFLKIKKE